MAGTEEGTSASRSGASLRTTLTLGVLLPCAASDYALWRALGGGPSCRSLNSGDSSSRGTPPRRSRTRFIWARRRWSTDRFRGPQPRQSPAIHDNESARGKRNPSTNSLQIAGNRLTERSLHTREVAGSSPAVPILESPGNPRAFCIDQRMQGSSAGVDSRLWNTRQGLRFVNVLNVRSQCSPHTSRARPWPSSVPHICRALDLVRRRITVGSGDWQLRS